MQFDIEDFKSVITGRDGALRTNSYVVEFFPPTGLNGTTTMMRELSFLADQAVLPGVNINAGEVRRYGYGPIEKRPISHTFNDMSISFIMTGDGEVFEIFHSWITTIAPHNMNLGINHPSQPYLLSYKNDYITDIRIKILNQVDIDMDPAVSLVFRETFPIAMADTQFAWTDNNNIARLNVQFTYTDWFIE